MATKKKAPPVKEPEEKEEVIEESVEASGVSQEALLALGVEMNDIMYPDDRIDYESLDYESLLEQVKGDAVNIDPNDPFSEESKETLAILGIEIAWTPAKPAKGKKTKPEAKPAVKPEKPPKPAKENPVKAEKPEKAKPTPKPAKEKVTKPAKEETSRYTRSHALLDALALGGNRKEVIEKADALFVANGGLSNMRVSDAMFGYVTPSLLIIKAITKDEKNIFSRN